MPSTSRLVELETDKVTIEVPAPAAGVLSEIAAKNGDTVAVGALLGAITPGAGGSGGTRCCACRCPRAGSRCPGSSGDTRCPAAGSRAGQSRGSRWTAGAVGAPPRRRNGDRARNRRRQR